MKPALRMGLTAVAFDLYWALVVMFRERGVWLWLSLAVLAWIMLSPVQRRAALLLAVAGCALDTTWVMTGLIEFNSPALMPLWMMALWLMFATLWTWLTAITRLAKWLLVLLASVGGPVAYVIGERLEAITFLASTGTVIGVMAGGWLLLMVFFHGLMGRTTCAS